MYEVQYKTMDDWKNGTWTIGARLNTLDQAQEARADLKSAYVHTRIVKLIPASVEVISE